MAKKRDKYLSFLEESTMDLSRYSFPGVDGIVNWRGQGGLPV